MTGRGAGWLPTGRAVVGGVLVATAAVGVLVAHQAATAPPDERYVVLTEDAPAGTPLSADQLGTVAAELPDGTTAVPEQDARAVIGRVLRTPVRSMDLLRRGDLVEPGRFVGPSAVEVSLDLSPARALAGTVQEGDRVDVLSTDPEGSGTTAVARGAVVTRAAEDDPDGAIGGAGTVRVRLALADASTAVSVVDAAVRTDLTLVLPSPAAATGGAR